MPHMEWLVRKKVPNMANMVQKEGEVTIYTRALLHFDLSVSLQTILVPDGSLATTHTVGDVLVLVLSGPMTHADVAASVGSAWIYRIRKPLALVIDAKSARPTGGDATEEQIRISVRRAAKRFPLAVVLRQERIRSGRQAALRMAADGLLLGVFTERVSALEWARQQAQARVEQARWQAARLARIGRKPDCEPLVP